MNTEKLLIYWRSILLGLVNGLFSSAVFITVERITIHYEELSDRIDAQTSTGTFYVLARQPFWNVANCTWHVILFIAASFLVHRYLLKLTRSVLLLWLLVGIAVITGWALTITAVTILIGTLREGGFPTEKLLELVFYTSNQRSAFKTVSVMMAINVVYGTVIQIAAKHYLQLGKERF